MSKLDAIREIHTHHEDKRESFRRQHGELYREFEAVHAELDALSTELNTLTDRGIALDANFSRYGYSAHIRQFSSESIQAPRALTDP